MDYRRIYQNLISHSVSENRARFGEIYYEGHHIIPRCMNGSNDKLNIALLTPREHFIAHLLLVKIYPQERKLIYALNMMCVGNNRKQTNRTYGKIKELIIENNKPMLGKKHSEKTKEQMSRSQSKENNHFFGKSHTDESKKKMRGPRASNWAKGVPKSEEQRKKISETLKRKIAEGKLTNGMSGKKHTEDSKRKMSETRKKNKSKD